MLNFHSCGEGARYNVELISGAEQISLGRFVDIKGSIKANPRFSKQNPKLIIGDRSFVNANSGIEAYNKVVIGKYVLISSFCYIADGSHAFSQIHTPIKYQGIEIYGEIHIKDSAWIGAATTIFGNVTIGYGSVIGANSVVTKNIPDHCVATGNPARVIKVCDYRTEQWISVEQDPQLLEKILNERGIFPGYQHAIIEGHIERLGGEHNI